MKSRLHHATDSAQIMRAIDPSADPLPSPPIPADKAKNHYRIKSMGKKRNERPTVGGIPIETINRNTVIRLEIPAWSRVKWLRPDDVVPPPTIY